MPLIQNINLMDVTLAEDLTGPYGVSSPAGLLVHRYVHDLSTQTPLSIVNYTMFDPQAAVLPLVFFGAYYTWDLDDANATNTRVGIGGNAGVGDNLVQVNPISLASNLQLRGVDPIEPGFSSAIVDIFGGSVHPHFARGLSTTTGLPILLHVDTSGAAANPYSGKIMAYLLFMSLA